MPVRRPLSAALQANAQLVRDWDDFGVKLQEISAALTALPDHVSFRIDGPNSGYLGLVTAPDLRRKFDNISWTLTDASFSNGGVGEIASQWSDPNRTVWLSADQKTRAADFTAYALHSQKSGLIYLALHETAHVTELGIRTWTTCWEAHKANGGNSNDYANTPLWTRNEAVANTIVRAVCLRLSLPQMQVDPNGGYVS